MAGESVRHLIMDSVITALGNISTDNGYKTNVATVSENLRHWEEIDFDEFPICFPIDADEIKSQSAITGTANMEGTLTVIITSMVFSSTNATRTARTNLMRDVEKAIMNGSTLAGLDIVTFPTRVITDKGNIPNYSVWDQEFEIIYHYSSVSGG